jgi:excisionase family DNA binding protein
MPREKAITLTEAAERLGVHYMTAYRYVRTGRLAAAKAGHEWQVREDDLVALQRELSGANGRPRRGTRRPDHGARLVDRLLQADEPGAWAVVEAALTGGMEPEDLYLQLLAPALNEVGERWARGEITVADEHRASAVVLRLIGRLGPRFSRRGRKRGTILLGTAPGERHGLPTALLRDLLRGHGFDVIDLGPDVPLDSWVATVAATPRLLGVGLCATTPDNDANVAATNAALHSASAVPVVLGGSAVADADHARQLGATAHSGSFEEALTCFEALPPPP